MSSRPVRSRVLGQRISVARVVCLVILTSTIAFAEDPAPKQKTPVDYAGAVGRLEQVVEAELARGFLTGLSIALVDDQKIVFSGGFGFDDKESQKPATAKTVYRAGSISKLFTALSVMRLVEQGKLDLDQPITTYLPDFGIVVPFEDCPPITLRQLMCHRSGLIREAPLGGYLDDSEPTIEATVASVAPCVLVHRPNSTTKYSNLGVTVVGLAVARVSGMPFERLQREHVLGPMGLNSSGFALTDAMRKRLSTSYMRVADGQGGSFEIKTPHFELGTIPAGNLYTTAEDLARFLTVLFARGMAGDKRIVRSETLDEMFTPQLIGPDEGFGLGFHVGRYREHKKIGHTGAVYGFSSSLVGLTEHKLGVVVLANQDIVGGAVSRVSNAALDLLLKAKLNQDLPPEKETTKLDADKLAPYTGDYESESYWARIDAGDGVLLLDISGQPVTLACTSTDEFQATGRWVSDSTIEFKKDDTGRITGFGAAGQDFTRVDPDEIAQIPQAWKKFLGSYGPEFIPLVVSVKHGHRYAMTENMVDYRLTPLNQTVFQMPPGMYLGEQLVFQVDEKGAAHSAVLANMTLRRIDR